MANKMLYARRLSIEKLDWQKNMTHINVFGTVCIRLYLSLSVMRYGVSVAGAICTAGHSIEETFTNVAINPDLALCLSVNNTPPRQMFVYSQSNM